jgi:putative membrane protein
MLIQLLIFIALGILAGTFTGLIPGIHVNLIGVILITLSTKINLGEIYFIIFIASMAVTHTFLDFIPSVFLGCPDTDTELSILPSHQLLKEGRGFQAVMLSNYGSILSILIMIFITPLLIFIIPKISLYIKEIVPYLLIGISIFLIFKEKEKIKASFIFLLTGILGMIILNLDTSQPLLPMLTGLFGLPLLITSIKNKIQIPIQKIYFPKTKLIKPMILSSIFSPICSFFPGIGTSQAAILASSFSKMNQEEFLVLIGATNTFVMITSFITLYTISKTRTGMAQAISEILPQFSFKIFILIIFATIITGIISFFLTIYFTKIFSQKINKINYTKLNILVLSIVLIINILIGRISGMIILAVATLIGLYANTFKIKKTNMMGCLIIPTISFYLF